MITNVSGVETDFNSLERMEQGSDDISTTPSRREGTRFSCRSGDFIVDETLKDEAWFIPTVRTLLRFLDLPINWDSYGAVRIEVKNVLSALNLLEKVMRQNTPPPTVVATSDGSVQLEWHQRDIDIEIYVRGENRFGVFFDDALTSTTSEDEVTFDLTDLQKFIDTLSERQ